VSDPLPFGRLILSLCDFTGSWSQPYLDAGYDVQRVDLKHGGDVRLLDFQGSPVHGILAAPPCTSFAGSGAQYWPAKDEDGRTLDGLSIVDACLRAVAIYRPEWWALENPVGRLRRWLGPPRLIFQPCDYGDAYTKRTCLWGDFNADLPQTPVTPERVCSQGSWLMRYGGSSERTKEARSVTPPGFARAFFEANP
jgi:hypothetical protein